MYSVVDFLILHLNYLKYPLRLDYFLHLFQKQKRLILTHRKDLLIGDYLIDDRLKNGAGEFKGELIHFGTIKFPDWKTVLEYLL